MERNTTLRKNPSRETCENIIKRILMTEVLENGSNKHFRFASDFMNYFESLYPASDALTKQVQRAIKSLDMPKDENGYLYTWGSNYSGQLGDGTTTNRTNPICISEIEGSVLKGKNITDIYELYYEYAPTLMVKDEEGKIYRWGTTSIVDYTYSDNPVCLNEENKELEEEVIQGILTDSLLVDAVDEEGYCYLYTYIYYITENAIYVEENWDPYGG